jgi:hypothetical protein
MFMVFSPFRLWIPIRDAVRIPCAGQWYWVLVSANVSRTTDRSGGRLKFGDGSGRAISELPTPLTALGLFRSTAQISGPAADGTARTATLEYRWDGIEDGAGRAANIADRIDDA